MPTFSAPLVPGIGSYSGAIKAAAPRPKPPAVVAPQTLTPPAVGSTGDGLTLDALLARQKQAAAMQGNTMQQEVTNIPQGLSSLAWTVVNALKERAAGRELETGQQEVADAFGKMNWETGQLPPEAMQTLFRRDPENAMQLYQTAMALRAQQAKTENWVSIPTPQGESGQWFKNTVNNETKKIGGSEGATGPGGVKATDVGALADDFTNTPDVKNFQNGQSMWLSMQDAATTDTAQADLNMIIAAAKLFDPTSVVRTEEGKAVELTGDAPSSIKGYFQYLTGTPGARLSRSTRQGLMNEAYSRINSYYKGVQQASTYYGEKATRWGYNPADVIRPFDAPAVFDPEKVVGSGEDTTPPEQTPDSTTVPDDGKPGTPTPENRSDFVPGTKYVLPDGSVGVYISGDPNDPKSWKKVRKAGQ